MNIKKKIKKNRILHGIFRTVKKFLFIIGEKVESVTFTMYTVLVQLKIIKEDSRFSIIKELKNQYKGKRCFIICTGPSLTIDDLEKLKDELTISMNSIVNVLAETTFVPTIYMVQDFTAYKLMKAKFKLLKNCQILVGVSNIHMPLFGHGIKIKDVKDKKIGLYHLDTASIIYNVNYDEKNFWPKFSYECEKRICDGATVTYSAIQLAKYMGCSSIYLLGADCNYLGERRHIDDCTDNYRCEKSQLISAAFRHNKSYEAAKRYINDISDVKIYNATRGGKLEVYERVDLDELLRK